MNVVEYKVLVSSKEVYLSMKKTVIFLGAGASKSDGAPLQKELFSTFFETCEKMGEKFEESSKYRESIGIVKQYFQDFFGFEDDFDWHNFDYKTAPFPRFEEVLGILDLAINRKEEYKENTTDLWTYRKALIFSMAQAIQYELKHKNTESDLKNHSKLVEILSDEIKKRSISFISTNYDLLIDDALQTHNITPNYGFCLGDEATNLIKIHGSLNWKYCKSCKHIEPFNQKEEYYEAYVDMDNFRCNKCNSKAQYIIVPPTYYKDMSNIYLSNIWYAAEKILMEAEHIIFCGYSLPNADMHIKYLLKRAEINRKDNLPLKVSVINAPKDMKANPKENLRFNRFFKTKDINFYSDVSFEDFAESPFKFL